MSYKMYLFQVKKGEEFSFVDDLRKLVLSEFTPSFKDGKDKIKYADMVQDNKDEQEKELQFFSVSHPDYQNVYLVRVMEAGYRIHNYLWKQKVPTCNYDDRTDVPAEDEGHKEIADEIDALIDQRHYFIIPVVSVTDLLRIIWNTPYLEKVEEQPDDSK